MTRSLIALISLAAQLFVGNVLSQPVRLDSLTVQLALHPQDDTTKVHLLIELSYQLQYTDFHRSLEYADQAQKMAEVLADDKCIAVANYRKGYCFWALGFYESAIESALTAGRIAEKYNYKSILAESFRILAMSYRDQQDTKKAEFYINQAEKLAAKASDWDLLSRIYNTAGLIESDTSKSDSSLFLFQKALTITEVHPTAKFQVCQILSNMGEHHLEKNLDLSLSFFRQALAKSKESGNKLAEAGILCDVGRVLSRKKRYVEADSFLLAGLKLSRVLGLKRVTRYAYLALVDLKEREGKAVESFRYMKNYYDVRDSLLNAAKTRQIVELESKFENEKREQAILLLKQEKRIQAIWKNVLIAGSLMLIVTLIVIYRLQQLRNRKAKQLLATQKQLNANLKETDLLKSRFFANISHEFRTPLSLILAPVEEKINHSSLPDKDKDDLKLVKRNADRLLDLVNQLLDLSKLEAGKMKLQLQDGDLNNFLKVIIASFDGLAESKGINFFKNVVPQKIPFLFDADKLEKIIANVLFNAFKFTPRGGSITLSLYATQDERYLKIKIADTGKGISQEDQAHLFTPFCQPKNISDDGQLGTGLGLSLVNELVKLHKGEIGLTSKPNEGTTIEITIPIHQVQIKTNAIATNSTQPLHTQKVINDIVNEDKLETIEDNYEDSILVVEDNSDLRAFIASSFNNQFTVITAADGKEGLSLALERIPNLIISDVMMPLINGVDLSIAVKSDQRTSHIPIVLLTAKTDSEDRMKGLKTGADDYLPKPFSVDELKVRVINLIDQRKKLIAKYKLQIEKSNELPESPSLDEQFILKAKEVAFRYLDDTQFGVELLAEEMNLSRAQLFRKFKALAGISPSEFISDVRLNRAAELIKSKADTLSQISYSVGFNEQSYFAKRFRKKFGMSPSEYAEANAK